MTDLARCEHPAPRPREDVGAQEADDQELSPEAAAALAAGLESARRGEIKRWGDFTQFIGDDAE